jgi:hypothetical protein
MLLAERKAMPTSITKWWMEEHRRGDRTLLVILFGNPKGAAEIRGSFETQNEQETIKWQKAMEYVNSTSTS